MKYVEGFVSSKQDSLTTLFNKTGGVIEPHEVNKISHYAKIIQTNASDSKENYYIRVHQGALFDPSGPYGKRDRVLDTQMKRVSKNTFDMYVTYLKTNNSIYLTKAQRGFLND
jgi:hypothetical protein